MWVPVIHGVHSVEFCSAAMVSTAHGVHGGPPACEKKGGERVRERGREKGCVCVFMCERERERERGRGR